MKGNRKIYIFMLLIVLFLVGCGKGEAFSEKTFIGKDYNGIDLESINSYKMDIKLNYNEKTYEGKQWTTYRNNTDTNLEEIYFHLYPNAFKSLETAPILFSTDIDDPLSFKTGYIDIQKVTINDKDIVYETHKEINTILKLELNEKLSIGEEITIYFEYKVKLPSAKDRFGYGDRGINLGNWYPIVCVYDENGWNLDPYYKLGDPFYSDVSNYKVNIRVPKDIIVAASGNILSEKVSGEDRIYDIEGKLIRDFAWVASPEFKIMEKEVEGTKVKLYYLDKNTSMINYSFKVGINSLKVFNKVFGKYPYGQYSIVMTEFPTGMEYPGLVFIGNDYFVGYMKEVLEQIIVHETAHQWWYGIVGNDQIDEAWLDEGLATYSEVIYNNEIYGEKAGDAYLYENIKIGYEFGMDYLGKDERVMKSLKDFYSWDDYGILVYTKGAMFINQIEEDYGRDILYKILQTYFNKYKFYNATTEDFIKICEDITGDSFNDLVQFWLY